MAALVAHHQEEVAELRRQLTAAQAAAAAAREQAEEAAQQKVAALMRVADAESAAKVGGRERGLWRLPGSVEPACRAMWTTQAGVWFHHRLTDMCCPTYPLGPGRSCPSCGAS